MTTNLGERQTSPKFTVIMGILWNRCVFLHIAFTGSVFTWIGSICCASQVDFIAHIWSSVTPCIQYLTECVKLQLQIFQRQVEDVFETLIIWRCHKDVLGAFNWKMLMTYCRWLQIWWLEVEIKTFWRREFFNLEDTFWTSIKHFHLSHLKALWRRFAGSISKSLKHTM